MNDHSWTFDDGDDAPLSSAVPSTEPRKLTPPPTAPRGFTPVTQPQSYYNAPPPPPIAELPVRDAVWQAPRRAKRDWAWVTLAATIFLFVMLVGFGLVVTLRSNRTPAPTAVPATEVAMVLPTPVDARIDFSDSVMAVGQGDTLTLDDGSTFVLQPWDGESRFTLLAMGLDRRPGETGLIYRTDTMMLISIDPNNDTIGILSIPRDLYVEVPGYSSFQRVNSPMVLGEMQQPGFGPELAMQTVQYNLGIRIHDYVIVDFDAVITMIDAIGGIDVEVPYDITDNAYPDMYYGFDPFFISAGLHHLDGVNALKYARTRHASSDFQRAERQQQVLYAVRDRVLDMNMLPSLIAQSPSLLRSLDENFYTGLTPEQLIQLAWYVKDVPRENIQTGVIGPDYVIGHETAEGASVLIPNRDRISSLMVEVFGANYANE